jgi:hypothetical protein
MELKKCIGSCKSLILLYLCTLAIFYFCISCSNVNKVKMNKEASIQIELDLIEDCIHDFINLAINNPDYYYFNVTLETLEGERLQFKNSEDTWVLRKWVIDKVGSQEPVAQYSYDFNGGSNSKIYTLFLYKQNGVYKVKNWDAEELWGLEEIKE